MKTRSLDRGQSSSIVVDETSPAESKRTRLASYQSVDAPQITMREVQLTKEVARLQGLLQKSEEEVAWWRDAMGSKGG
jgi:hypothetical protein